MELIVKLDRIQEAAKIFWDQANGKVFAFHGEMGAGKTTFIIALCAAKGIVSAMGSPTFSLVNEYVFVENHIQHSIFHLDLYRIKDEEEAINAGIEECLYSGNICFVEWPEKISRLLPEAVTHVHISAIDETSRLVKIADDQVNF